MKRGSWVRRMQYVLLCCAFVAPTIVGLAIDDRVAVAANGYQMSSEGVYHYNVERSAVEVSTIYKMSNVKQDQQIDGGVRFFYFTAAALPIDANASNISIQVNGSDASFGIEPDGAFSWLDVAFRSNLDYGETFTIDVSYDLLGDPPRTVEGFTRVNEAYVSFPIIAFAEDGTASVTVQVPETWEVEYVGNELEHSTGFGLHIYAATDIDNPTEFNVAFTARYDDSLSSEMLEVDDADFEIRAWPGDDVWTDFSTSTITNGVQVLEAAIGEEWPTSDKTTVIENSTPYLHGYGGYYYAFDNLIEVGEDLDTATLLHELAHVWFNSSTVVDRWIVEGLAEHLGTQAALELGEDISDHGSSGEDISDELGVDPIEPFPLNDWGSSANSDSATETFGYDTSYVVMNKMYVEIGGDAMSRLLSATARGVVAYRGEGSEVTSELSIDWREFLDLAEQHGGSDSIEGLYREYIVTSPQYVTLDLRRDTIVEYKDLVQRSGSWAPPQSLRTNMADWSFQLATSRIEDAHKILDSRDELLTVLEPIGLTTTAAIETDYQDTEGSLDEVTARLQAQLVAAPDLVAARAELAEVLDGSGQDVPDLDQADYEKEPIGLAAETDAMVDDAVHLTDTQQQLETVLAEFGLSVPDLAPEAFSDDPAAAQETLEDQLSAAEATSAAHLTDQMADSFVERVGAIGTSIAGPLAEADRLLADGDYEGATAAASEAVDDVERYEDAGVLRLSIAAGLLAALLLIILVVWRRRRRRTKAQTTTTTGDLPVDRVVELPVAEDRDQ